MVKGQRNYRFVGKKLLVSVNGRRDFNWLKHKSRVSSNSRWCSSATSARVDQSYTHQTNGVSTTNDNYVETDWNSDK